MLYYFEESRIGPSNMIESILNTTSKLDKHFLYNLYYKLTERSTVFTIWTEIQTKLLTKLYWGD
jgi:hypothetical protein